MMQTRKLLLGGEWVDGAAKSAVRSPWNWHAVTEVAQASETQALHALEVASQARERVAGQTTAKRREVLFGIADRLRAGEAELVDAIVQEAGKPRGSALAEVRRAVETFTLAASELPSFGGRTFPVDLAAASAGYECETRRFPAGVVVGIVPFNFPLNLGAHKIAPALAVGAPIIIKPPPQAPSAMLLVGKMALEAGADPAALQVLPCDNSVAERLATDARARVLSFTGSARVGWHLKAKAPGKVVLELGGNAAVVVCADAQLDWAAERSALGAFSYAGQVCIKVQRIIVEAPVFAPFLEKLSSRVRALAVGDPNLPDTVVGPVIDDAAADRIMSWVQEAESRGAKALIRGERKGRLITPIVLTDVPRDTRVYSEEIFGPVALVGRAADFDDALKQVNDTKYGLQAGVFTSDLARVRRAFRQLEVGGVIVNDYPTFRVDNFPYGGVKASGLGREGVRSAMEELTEERVLITRLPPQ
jgi:acyl-CoA reductase-like NAD-dependent aldehyde dehydrogenase